MDSEFVLVIKADNFKNELTYREWHLQSVSILIEPTTLPSFPGTSAPQTRPKNGGNITNLKRQGGGSLPVSPKIT